MDYQNIFSLFQSGVGAAKYLKVTLQTKRGLPYKAKAGKPEPVAGQWSLRWRRS